MKNVRIFLKVALIGILGLILSNIIIFAQSPGVEFKPNARVTLSDNTIVELSNFEIHARRIMPKWYFEGVHEIKMDIPFKRGNLWQEISFKDIDKFILTNNNNPDGWINTEIILLSGDSLKGYIPPDPHYLWEKGRDITINGSTKVLGREGLLELSILELKEVKRDKNNPSVFILTTKENEIKTLTNPYLSRNWSGNTSEFSTYKTTKKYFPELKFMIDGQELAIHMGDIDSLYFSDINEVFLKLKDGNEATCTFKTAIDKIKGDTKSGLIWYQSFRNRDSGNNVKSIKFL